MKLWISFPKLFFSLVPLAMVLSCQRLPTSSYYERTFTPEEQKQLAVTLLEGIKNYYQGSSAEQMLLFEALAYDSTNAKVVREIGVPYLKRGFVSAFPKYYGRAADLDPLGWTGWRAYLYLYFYRDYDRAIRDFDATDIITPNQVDYPQSLSVDYLRGIAYLMKKDYHNALKYLNQHIAYESEITGREYVSAQAYLYKALALRALGELEHARTILIQAAIYHPYNADLLYWQAKVLQEQGDYTAARPLLQRARAAFAANDYNRHPYVEEFFQLYPDDFVTLESALNRHSTVE